jgi:hypothetical protein
LAIFAARLLYPNTHRTTTSRGTVFAGLALTADDG